MDFALLLVFFTMLTGIIWLLDILWLAKQRSLLADLSTASNTTTASAVEAASAATPKKSQEPWWVEYSKAFFPGITDRISNTLICDRTVSDSVRLYVAHTTGRRFYFSQ